LHLVSAKRGQRHLRVHGSGILRGTKHDLRWGERVLHPAPLSPNPLMVDAGRPATRESAGRMKFCTATWGRVGERLRSGSTRAAALELAETVDCLHCATESSESQGCTCVCVSVCVSAHCQSARVQKRKGGEKAPQPRGRAGPGNSSMARLGAQQLVVKSHRLVALPDERA